MSATLRRVLRRTFAVALILSAMLAILVLVRAFVGAPMFDWVSIGVGISVIAATLVAASIAEIIRDTVRLRAFWLGSSFVLALFLCLAVASWVHAGELHLPNASTSAFLFALVVVSGVASHFCIGRGGPHPPSSNSLERMRGE